MRAKEPQHVIKKQVWVSFIDWVAQHTDKDNLYFKQIFGNSLVGFKKYAPIERTYQLMGEILEKSQLSIIDFFEDNGVHASLNSLKAETVLDQMQKFPISTQRNVLAIAKNLSPDYWQFSSRANKIPNDPDERCKFVYQYKISTKIKDPYGICDALAKNFGNDYLFYFQTRGYPIRFMDIPLFASCLQAPLHWLLCLPMTAPVFSSNPIINETLIAYEFMGPQSKKVFNQFIDRAMEVQHA